VNFIDTADVYGDGHSERLIAQLRNERSEEIIFNRHGEAFAQGETFSGVDSVGTLMPTLRNAGYS
jgi:hypothetical protein